MVLFDYVYNSKWLLFIPYLPRLPHIFIQIYRTLKPADSNILWIWWFSHPIPQPSHIFFLLSISFHVHLNVMLLSICQSFDFPIQWKLNARKSEPNNKSHRMNGAMLNCSTYQWNSAISDNSIDSTLNRTTCNQNQ